MDLLAPKTDNENSRKLPWGLGILIIIQLLFFFTVQFDNEHDGKTAVNFYFDSELNKVEFPIYLRYLQKYMANDVFYQRLENISSGNMSNIEMYWLIHYDPFFQKVLETRIIRENNLYHINWQKKRDVYKKLLKKDIVQTYAFNTAEPSILGIIISLFLSENLTQFIVNILFLIIVGLLLEAKIGMKWLIASYFIGGLLMISFYCVLSPLSLIPLAATNGAIICLLGLLTTLYGIKKEKIYYYNSKKISFIYVACFIFLPFWIIIEYALFSLDLISTINIYTQLLPLIGGLMLGFYLKSPIANSLSMEEDIL